MRGDGIPLTEAAAILSEREHRTVTPEAVRKRIQRKSLDGYKDGLEWRAILPAPIDLESQAVVPVGEEDAELVEVGQGLDQLLMRLDRQADVIQRQAETIGELREQVRSLKRRVEGLLTLMESRDAR